MRRLQPVCTSKQTPELLLAKVFTRYPNTSTSGQLIVGGSRKIAAAPRYCSIARPRSMAGVLDHFDKNLAYSPYGNLQTVIHELFYTSVSTGSLDGVNNLASRRIDHNRNKFVVND